MKKLTILVLLILWAGTAQAQSRSLDYYLTHAIDNSPVITAQRDRADSARLQKKITHANFALPSVSATGDYQYDPYSDHWGYAEPITDGGHYSALLNVDYPVFASRKREVRNKESSVSIRQNEYQIDQVKHELRQSVTDQYITTYQDVMHLRYLQNIQDLLQKQKGVLQSLAKRGVAKITDVKQLGIELQNNRISQKQAENIYQQDLLQLNSICGIADSSTSVALQEPSLVVDSSQVDQSKFMKQFQLDSAKVATQQQLSELKYQPNVSLYGSSGLNAIKFTGIQNHFGYSVGLHVSVPIFDGNQKSITRQQTSLQQHSIDAYQQRFKTKRQIHLESLRRQLKQNHQQLELAEQQLSQYEDLLNNYRQELSQGVLSVIDYLTVLRNYADAQQQRIQTLGRQWQLKNEFNYWNW